MIKGLTGGKYIIVSGGSSSTTYVSPGSVGAGMLRYNSNMNGIEVNDGVVWKQLDSSFATIQLDAEAESLLDWAKKERDKQLARELAVKNNPALQKAYEAILRAEENFDLLETIARQHSSDESEQYEAASSGP